MFLGLIIVVVSMSACRQATPASGKTAPSSSAEMTHAVVDPYLKIDIALAADSVDGVQPHAREIATAATQLGSSAAPIESAAVQLASADDLAAARVKFGVLSEAIDAYMAAEHLRAPAGVRVAFCPMVLKPWMQADGSIRNPYYGSQMLTCGSFRN